MRCSLSRPARTLTRRLRFLDLTVRRSGLEGQRAVAKHVFEMLVDDLLTIVLARHGDVRGAAAARRLHAGVVAPVPAVRRHGPERRSCRTVRGSRGCMCLSGAPVRLLLGCARIAV